MLVLSATATASENAATIAQEYPHAQAGNLQALARAFRPTVATFSHPRVSLARQEFATNQPLNTATRPALSISAQICCRKMNQPRDGRQLD